MRSSLRSDPPRRSRRETTVAWATLLLALLLPGAWPVIAQPGVPAAAPTAAANSRGIRFGFSRSMFREVNENDARASLKAYAGVIAHDQNLTADPDPILFEGAAEMEESLRHDKVDVIAGLAAEMLALPEGLVTGPYLVAVKENVVGMDYLLLTRVDSDIKTLADLKGRRVAVLTSVRGSLTNCWLDVLLGAGGLGVPRLFFSELKSVAKPSLAVLPVFFRQLDACVITREGFAIAGEMNPQVGRQLRILATSSLVVPVISCFRRGFDPSLQRGIVTALSSLRESVAGRQLLTIFQSEMVEARDESDLAATRQLLADHTRLTADPGSKPATRFGKAP